MGEEYWIAVVDDDISNLKVAGSILSENGMRVTALSSGPALLGFIADGNVPDLILLDVLMPAMDGFETLEKLRSHEREVKVREAEAGRSFSGIPVVFLTAEENEETEERAYSLGALGVIKKPFDPALLVQRTESITAGNRRMKELSEGSSKDKLTGLFSKAGIARLLTYELGRHGGVLLLVDVDGFRMINDIYGHEAGDKLLTAFSVLLRNNVRHDDSVGRTGSDEFVIFMKDMTSADAAVKLVRDLNSRLLSEAKIMFGDNTDVPLGVSGGAVVAEQDRDYRELYDMADRMLFYAKRGGKHECVVFNGEETRETDRRHSEELTKISTIFDEHSTEHRALCLGGEPFGIIYRYIMRHIQRYKGIVQKVLITADTDCGVPASEFSVLMEELCELAAGMLRNSDMIYRSSSDQLFLLLPMVSAADLPGVMERIFDAWYKDDTAGRITLSYVSEQAGDALPELPEIDGLDWRYAKLNLPTERLLKDTVADLYSSIPKRIEKLEGFFENIDETEAIRGYRTEVHALKSASALIGLMQLSGLAKLLEKYAGEGDAESVKLFHGVLVKECGKAHEEIGKAFGFAGENKTKPDGKAMLPALLGVLEGSLRDMDMEAADRVMTKIRSYSYDEDTANALDRLARAAVELDESAYDIIKELKQ